MGSVARRRLNIFVLADTSSSMASERIETLNQVARSVLPKLVEVELETPAADFFLQVLAFADDAQWLTPEPIRVSAYKWRDLQANGSTRMGRAFDSLRARLDPEVLGPYNYPPIIILLTDGAPTDDWKTALDAFNKSPFGSRRDRTVRCAIAIGKDANLSVLTDFTGDADMVLVANNATQLTQYFIFATVTLSRIAASGQSTGDPNGGLSVSTTAQPAIAAAKSAAAGSYEPF